MPSQLQILRDGHFSLNAYVFVCIKPEIVQRLINEAKMEPYFDQELQES
jgi:hypothetical protein